MDPTQFSRDMAFVEATLKFERDYHAAFDRLADAKQTLYLSEQDSGSWFIPGKAVKEFTNTVNAVRRNRTAVLINLEALSTVVRPMETYAAAYKSLYEQKGDPRVANVNTTKLDTVLSKYAGMKSSLARQIVEDIRAALES